MKEDFSYGLVPIYQEQNQVEFLLTQHIEGHWAFPKGHAEGDENHLAAAQREFEEETGLKHYQVDDEVSFTEEYYPTKDGQILHKTVTYFPAFVEQKGVKIQEEEVQDYAWLPYAAAQKRLTFTGSKRVLRETRAYLKRRLRD
jgi:8-oxo-dGTP pyrophosphatase MutT (NUDIX family)